MASCLGASFLGSSLPSFFLSFFGIAFCGLLPAFGIGIIFTSPRILETLTVGFAPLLNQCLTLSDSILILSFFSLGKRGLKDPSFSINLPSLGNLLSATTILYTGLFLAPPIDNLIFNILFLSF